MEKQLENFIQIKGVQYTIDPTNEQEWSNCIDAAVTILGVMCFLGTTAVKDDKVRTEKMLKLAGEMGGAIAKHAIRVLASSVSATPEKGGKDA